MKVKRLLAGFFIVFLFIFLLITACKKAEKKEVVEPPASPTEPAPAPGEPEYQGEK
jgi:large-conductance mechanosensitive channel